MTTLFNEQNRIAITLLYLLMLLPMAARSQGTAALDQQNNPVVYCDASTTWNGTTWSNGQPEAGKDAIIAADYNFNEGTFKACSLNIFASVHVTFAQNTNVVITHNIHVAQDAEVVFESSSNLVQTEGQANTGLVTIKRNSSEIVKDDYTLWSSPVSGQLLLGFSPQTLTNRFYTFNTVDNIYNTITSPATTAFETAKGYLIRTGENHPLTPTTWEGRFKGTPTTGNISTLLCYNNANQAYNTVGNPYPSPISITKFIDANEGTIEGTLWLWRKTTDPGTSSYATVTKLGYQSNSETSSIQDPFTLHEEGLLNTAQGFLVKATVQQNLVFNNAMRLPVSSQSFFRPPPQKDNETSRFWLNVTGTNVFSQVLLGYTAEGTADYDNGLDGETLMDGKTTLYSFAGNKKLSIQARPEFEDNDSVPLGFKTDTAGTYTFSLNHKDGLFTQGQPIYIVDTANGSVTDITEEPYTFTIAAGTFENRFRVVYNEDTAGIENPVAIEKSIVAYSNNHQVKVQSSEEINSVAIYDITGRLLLKQDTIASADFTSAVLNVTVPVIVKITLNNGAVVSKKIVVQ
ncbi:hypothetical protein ACX0HA_15670 [Flavobacterium hauense]